VQAQETESFITSLTPSCVILVDSRLASRQHPWYYREKVSVENILRTTFDSILAFFFFVSSCVVGISANRTHDNWSTHVAYLGIAPNTCSQTTSAGLCLALYLQKRRQIRLSPTIATETTCARSGPKSKESRTREVEDVEEIARIAESARQCVRSRCYSSCWREVTRIGLLLPA
jgi:hypothetical protein